ncbi:MAG: hypothetical protein KKA60_05205 [Proteobacteria bacterium]|nr:hypothetical protein [Pseudomonadota bacterium]
MEPGKNPAIQTSWIVWGAMLTSVFLYGVVARIITAQGALPDMDVPAYPVLRIVFMTLGAALLFAAPAVGRKLEALPSVRAANPDPARQRLAAAMVSWAMAEAVGVFGLVLYFLGREPWVLYVFLGASAVGLVALRPDSRQYQG